MRWLIVPVLAVASLIAPVSAARPAAEQAASPLADYLANGDPTYAWVKRDEGGLVAASYVELTLTSQTWRAIPWRHQLFIIRPALLDAQTPHALLFIAGGKWEEPDGDGGEDCRRMRCCMPASPTCCAPRSRFCARCRISRCSTAGPRTS